MTKWKVPLNSEGLHESVPRRLTCLSIDWYQQGKTALGHVTCQKEATGLQLT